MNYCLFDGGDVIGPLPVAELLKREGFSAHSLVCPEEHSEDEAYWKEAHHYADFGFAPIRPENIEIVSADVAKDQAEHFLQEMEKTSHDLLSLDELAQGLSAASAAEEAAAQQVPLQEQPSSSATQQQTVSHSAADKSETAKTKTEESEAVSISSLLVKASKEMNQQDRPAESKEAAQSVAESSPAPVSQQVVQSRNPIEEYFDTMKSGDLENILGIPDPKANSDMNLARVLEKQFEKTDPDLARPLSREDDPFAEFTSDHKPTPLDEKLFDPVASAETDKQTRDQLDKSLPAAMAARQTAETAKTTATTDANVPAPIQADCEKTAGKTAPEVLQTTTEQEAVKVVLEQQSTVTDPKVVVAEQGDDPEDQTVERILEGNLQVNTQRQELQEPLKQQTQQQATMPVLPSEIEESVPPHSVSHQLLRVVFSIKNLMLVGFIILLGALGAVCIHTLQSNANVAAVAKPLSPNPVSPITEMIETPSPAVPVAQSAAEAPRETAAVAAVAEEEKSLEEQAKDVVRNYVLDQQRGTIENYLKKRYAAELASGYTASWSAEPLHRQIYVVKYRLAKTRKEPIVYIFQANPTKKKLTGALNNITLDLVGKLN